ncbi:MAG: heavy metal translocating P-type ATPase [Gammaproteobacteria bacterium]|nr:heavy metal translocating P-type ATPase [Gammaproteobacteria bacterium]
MDCKLCGLPAAPNLEEDGNAFCCIGCRGVYQHFGHIILSDSATEAHETIVEPEGEEAFLRIDGMHCSSCEILIERLALKTKGIVAAKTSYATATAKITYDPSRVNEADLPEILSRTGYQARFSQDQAPAYDYRMPMLRLVTAESLAATVMMLYLAFYYPVHLGIVDMAELEPVHWLVHKAVPTALLILTSILVFYVAIPIFRGAWIGIRSAVWNMDNLLAIAILAAYGFSIGQFFLGTLELYFDVAATIIAVVTIGRYFEREARENATSALTKIMYEWAPSARVYRDGKLQMLAIDELHPAEHILVYQGELIPADGIIVEGQCAVDESLMTGEPFPITRVTGDRVLGGTRNVEGSLEIEVGHVVASQLNNLARVLWNAQSANAGVLNLGDRVARFFVPVVLLLALAVGLWFYSNGASPGSALLACMATLIVSCPCTFGLAIPLTSAVGLNIALRNGIIIASGDAFEKAKQIHTIAIDKTGILSTANMAVSNVSGPPEVAKYAAAVERLSPHPIAEAIARLDSSCDAQDIKIHAGKGAMAQVKNHRVAVGSKSLFTMLGWKIPEHILAPDSAQAVNSYVGWDGEILGFITTEDQPRPGWQRIVGKLRKQARTVLLTGAESAGDFEDKFDEIFCGIPPEGKAAVIRQLKSEGIVVMIGDGSNDAPSLAEADLGIAFGAPTALAADAADVIIPGDRLDHIFTTFEILQSTRRRIRQNLAWALLYNAIAIPIAVCGLLNPLFAALAMSSSSLLVIWNSSRRLGDFESS